MRGPEDDPSQRPREVSTPDGGRRMLPPGVLPWISDAADAPGGDDSRRRSHPEQASPGPDAADGARPPGPRLLAISDLHLAHRGNEGRADALQPGHEDDWLIVAGDVHEDVDVIVDALSTLRSRFARVLYTPGNHDLYAARADGPERRGQARYDRLVAGCRDAGVDTPEDPWPVWEGAEGPVTVASLFLLYDYGLAGHLGRTTHERLEAARAAGIVATDEHLLDPAPHASRAAWCAERLAETEARLAALPDDARTVLVGHWPLHPHPLQLLRHPEFALWCGTPETMDWHRRFRATAVVYGHLHIPRRTWRDGVRFEEVSVGYPREWRRWGGPPDPRVILGPS